jgi:hypothetical protein
MKPMALAFVLGGTLRESLVLPDKTFGVSIKQGVLIFSEAS